MKCESKLCIYWTENACLLKKVSRDEDGRCTDFFSKLFDENESYPDEDTE